MNFIYRFGFFFINGFLIAVGVLQGRLVVLVHIDRSELRTVYGWNALVRCRVFYIFNTITAKNKRPIRFRVGVVLVQNLLVNRHCLVEIVVSTKMVGSVIKICTAFVVQFGQSLLCSAIFADCDSFIVLDFECAAAHFAFEYRHYLITFLYFDKLFCALPINITFRTAPRLTRFLNCLPKSRLSPGTTHSIQLL